MPTFCQCGSDEWICQGCATVYCDGLVCERSDVGLSIENRTVCSRCIQKLDRAPARRQRTFDDQINERATLGEAEADRRANIDGAPWSARLSSTRSRSGRRSRRP